MLKIQKILLSTIITLTYLGSAVGMDQEKERTQKEINAEKMWIYKEELDRHNLDLKECVLWNIGMDLYQASQTYIFSNIGRIIKLTNFKNTHNKGLKCAEFKIEGITFEATFHSNRFSWLEERESVPAPSQGQIETMRKLGTFKQMQLSYKNNLQPSDERPGEINTVSCIYSIFPECFMGLDNVSDIRLLVWDSSNDLSKLSIDQKILEKAQKDSIGGSKWSNEIEFTINPKSKDNPNPKSKDNR